MGPSADTGSENTAPNSSVLGVNWVLEATVLSISGCFSTNAMN